jgi:hypothetical protein
MTLWNCFVVAVHDHFAFLETEYGLVRQSEVPPFVTYESELVRARVYFDERHELDFAVERVGDDPRRVPSVGIAVMMRLANVPQSEIRVAPFPSTSDEVRREVEKLASLVRAYGDHLLRGDEARWRKVRGRS